MKKHDILRWVLTLFAIGISVWAFITVNETRQRLAPSFKDMALRAVEAAHYSNRVAIQALHERDSVIQILQNINRRYSESGEMLDGNEPVPLKSKRKAL